MARASASFVCQNCGAVHAKWSGKCDDCGAWNSIIEEAANTPAGATARKPAKGRRFALEDLKTLENAPPRRATGITEFDRVCGGGLVAGSALLVGGDPGVGKSTLILQALAAYAKSGGRAVYISGEEAMAQVRLRASRMELSDAPVELGSATCVEDILSTLESGPPPGIVAIDSIQTLWTSALEAAPGTIAQVRTASFDLVRYAKASGAAVLLVGHVTKDGQIAGPKAVEHLVDAVLYFEGERGHHFRVLRAVKNRFGPTDEIGVFEMTGKGLAEVANPSALFLGDRNSVSPGAAIFAGLEGTRPLLVEVQALVAQAGYGTPRRAVVGWDSGRLAMILAVLDARAGLGLSGHDVYLNVAGGLEIGEPAADLAAAAALVSSFTGRALPRDCVFFGEISLSGDVRPAPQPELRLKEAAKLGFMAAVVPTGLKTDTFGLELRPVKDVSEVAAFAGATEARTRRRGVVRIESMHDLSFTAVDILVVLTLIVSTALAIWRGFVRETLSIFAWAAAAFATLYFGPAAATLLRARFSTPYLGSVVAYGAVFLLVLIPLSFVSYRFSEGVKHSPIGAIDRSLGAAFGVIRGLAVVGLSYLLFSMIVPIPTQPAWITQARLLPVVQSSGDVLLSLVPVRDAHPIAVTSAAPTPDVPVPRPRPSPASRHGNKAYGADERRALDRLIQSTGGGGNNKP